MISDRDAIRHVLIEHTSDYCRRWQYSNIGESIKSAEMLAEAILAVLDGRIVPVLPEGHVVIEVYRHEDAVDQDAIPIAFGHGPDIVAATTDAVKGADDDDAE